MKVGLRKTKTDLSIKHIQFIVDGEEHFIAFRYTHKEGIQDDVWFDSKKAKIIDAYPSFVKVLKISASIILSDLHRIVKRKFARNK